MENSVSYPQLFVTIIPSDVKAAPLSLRPLYPQYVAVMDLVGGIMRHSDSRDGNITSSTLCEVDTLN